MKQVIAETQVCVIGAGIMGLSVAWQLARRGFGVLIVEKATPGVEATGATAGTLGVMNKPLPVVPLVLPVLEMWQRLSNELGFDVEYERRGGFRLAHSDEDVAKLEKDVAAQRVLGVKVELLYQPQLGREAPYLSSGVQAASYCALDGLSNPLAAVRALTLACAQLGVRLRSQCPVVGIDALGDDRFLVHTPAGMIRCDTVVGAAGAWNLDLTRMVGLDLPLTTVIMQVLVTDQAPALFPHIITHVRGNLTMKQKASGKILIGGAWPGEGDPVIGVKRVKRESLLGNVRWATENVPAVAKTQLLRVWVGLEGRTPDKMMLTGSVGAPAGFHLLGCSGGGYTLAPIAALMAAEYVTGAPVTADRERFHVRRFIHPLSPVPA